MSNPSLVRSNTRFGELLARGSPGVPAVGPNLFYTVTLPCTLWFLDRGKRGTDHEDKILFIDARHVFRQIDRAHREFTPEQLEFLANIARLYRGEEPESRLGSDEYVRFRTSPLYPAV